MKWIWCLPVLLFSCKTETTKTTQNVSDSTTTHRDTVEEIGPEPKPALKKYENARFRNVTVEKIDDFRSRVRGEGQIFEASFSWVIEDGHNELKKGFQTTDAGAPEWGKFDFVIDKPETMNATMTLILFEISAMDGSRQHELPIPLE